MQAATWQGRVWTASGPACHTPAACRLIPGTRLGSVLVGTDCDQHIGLHPRCLQHDYTTHDPRVDLRRCMHTHTRHACTPIRRCTHSAHTWHMYAHICAPWHARTHARIRRCTHTHLAHVCMRTRTRRCTPTQMHAHAHIGYIQANQQNSTCIVLT